MMLSLCLLGILVVRKHALWYVIIRKVLLIFSFLQNFDGLAVVTLLALEDTHDPLLAREGFREEVQLVVLETWVVVTHSIVTLGFSLSSVDLPSTVVRQPIHQRVAHGGGNRRIGTISHPSDVVFFLNVRIDSSTDPHHPQELIDIVSGVVTHTSVDDQHVINVQPIANFVGLVLW